MSPSQFSEDWGGVTICFLISFVLAGCVAVQACSYFSKFQKDPFVLKCAISVILLGCLLQFVVDCLVVHSYTISQYDVPNSDIIIPLGFTIGAGVEIVVHPTAQGAYIFRVYRFGHNRYLLACSCVLVLLELGFGFRWIGRVAITGVTAMRLDALSLDIEWDITTFFTISAFVDMLITASMTYQLLRSRPSSGFKRTKNLIDGIIRLTIPTGMLTSSVAIVIVLLWNLGKPGSFTWAGMCALEPCCYATGLLALLNARKTYFDHALDSDQGRQESMSLPMTILSTASGLAGLSNTPPHKAAQITGHVELQSDRDIYNLKSNFPFSSWSS